MSGQREAGIGRVELRKGGELADRLLRHGVAAIGLSRALPRDLTSRHIALQLVRSATSAGANYEEARAAESRADFAHKVGIAAKEIRESIYWLRLVQHTGLSNDDLAPLVQEAGELSAILVASRRTARAGTTTEGV